jgi:peptidyl-prolyl cis-trans isomerase A (cyclophilin A)
MIARIFSISLILLAISCQSSTPDTPASEQRSSSVAASRPADRAPSPERAAAAPAPTAQPTPPRTPAAEVAPAPDPQPAPLPPPSVEEARLVFEGMQTLAAAGNPSSLVPYIPKRDRAFLHRTPAEIQAALWGKVLGGEVLGGRVVLQLEPRPEPVTGKAAVAPKPVAPPKRKGSGKGGKVVEPPPPPKFRYAVLMRRPMGFRYDPIASERWAPPDPGPADPLNRDVPLSEALGDQKGKGRLVAEIDTTEGRLTCELFPDKAPRAVTAFVGLARGLRAFLDPGTKTWTRRAFYDSQSIHASAPGAYFSFGCIDRQTCPGVGFTVPDELDLSLRHDLPGRLGLDNADRPNQGAARFYITAAPDAERDDRTTILGQCGPLDVIDRISRASEHESGSSDGPLIRTVSIRREGSAAP